MRASFPFALLSAAALAACGSSLAPKNVITGFDGGCPPAQCPQPTPQQAAFGPQTLYLSDEIGRCQDALAQEGVPSPADVRFKWYRQVDGGYLAGSAQSYEYATLSTERLYNGGAQVGHKETIFWVWHTGLTPLAPGAVKVALGESAVAGAPIEASAPPSIATPGVYWFTVWAYGADNRLVAASESRPFCLGVSDAGALPSNAVDLACIAWPQSDAGCPEPPTSDHPDKP